VFGLFLISRRIILKDEEVEALLVASVVQWIFGTVFFVMLIDKYSFGALLAVWRLFQMVLGLSP